MRQHLLSRWLDPDRYSGVWIEEGVSATFAIWNFSGQMAGYQKYQPGAPRVHDNGSYSRYHSWFGERKTGVWGLETVDWRGGVLFLTEGVFNAARLHWHGHQAVAVIANDPKHLRSWLKTLPHHRVAVLDGDAAGRKLAKYGHQSVQMPLGEDVNSVSEEQFHKFFDHWKSSWNT